MRCFAAALISCALVVVGCNSHPITDQCPTVTRTGAAPACTVAATCIGAHTGVLLDCSANDGKCVCSMNGVIGETVSYKDAFCNSASTNEEVLQEANDACGWKL